jgi:uncharacterized membrane protein (UPF0127 family)
MHAIPLRPAFRQDRTPFDDRVFRQWTAPFRRSLAGVVLAAVIAGVPLAAAAADDAHAVLHTSKGDFPFTIEIADTEASREQGLMYRKSLAPDAGMLFDFHREQPVEFWMVNTLIPLDMIFIDADGTVKSVHADAVPEDATPIPSGVPVRFVFEIAGGRAAQIGLMPGDRLEQARVTPAKP